MAAEKFTGEVYRLIEQIAERTERISGYSGRVPLIEVDLAMENIRKLYDCFLLLRGSDGEAVLTPGPSAVISEDSHIADVSEEPVSEVVEGEPKGEPGGGEVISGVVADEPVVESVVPEQKPATSGSSRTILGERLRSGDKKSIHDLIAAKRSDRSISNRMQHNPITNLKHAIGLNEKFIFVYELFGGNALEYAAAIDRLNSMPGSEEAIGLMESMREQYHWDIENMAFQKLVDMVARRYN